MRRLTVNGIVGTNPDEDPMNTRLTALLAAAFIAGSCTLAIAQGAGGAPAAPKVDMTPGGPSPNAMRGGHMMGSRTGMMKHRMHRRHMMKRHHMMKMKRHHRMMMHKKKMHSM